jgi:hypothetical protein
MVIFMASNVQYISVAELTPACATTGSKNIIGRYIFIVLFVNVMRDAQPQNMASLSNRLSPTMGVLSIAELRHKGRPKEQTCFPKRNTFFWSNLRYFFATLPQRARAGFHLAHNNESGVQKNEK